MERSPALGRAAVFAAAFLCFDMTAAAQDVVKAPPAAQPVTVDLAQARMIGIAALKDNRPEVARDIARALIARDTKDGFGHYLLAESLARLGQITAARGAAAQAFRLAPQKADKFRAAQLAAKLSFDAKQPTRAQMWLRRSLPYAPHAQAREQVVQDYRVVRARNPLSFNLHFNVSPSSNVNGGSDGEYFLIDGYYFAIPFAISAYDQALKGLTISADLQTSYKLRESDVSETRLFGALGVTRVVLSQEAYDLAAATATPLDDDIENADFGSTVARVGLRHAFALPVGSGHHSAVSFSVGQTWYGGAVYQQLLQAGVETNWRLAPRTRLHLDFAIEERQFEDRAYGTTTSRSASAQIEHRLNSGDLAALSLSYTANDGSSRNATYDRVTLYAKYSFDQAIGPAKISLGLGMGTHDGLYRSFGTVDRSDRSTFGTVNFLFHDLDYAGFAPSVSLKARKNRSNVSRFDTTEMSVGFGIESSF